MTQPHRWQVSDVCSCTIDISDSIPAIILYLCLVAFVLMRLWLSLLLLVTSSISLSLLSSPYVHYQPSLPNLMYVHFIINFTTHTYGPTVLLDESVAKQLKLHPVFCPVYCVLTDTPGQVLSQIFLKQLPLFSTKALSTYRRRKVKSISVDLYINSIILILSRDTLS